MLYENQKLLTNLIDKIVISESENLVKEIERYKSYYEKQLEIVKEKNKKIDEMKNRMEQMSRDRAVIEHYESITWKYFVAEPQIEDVSWQWDLGIVDIHVIEVEKQQKYADHTPKQEEQKTELYDLPF